jgi:hypothetical protein
MCFDTCSRGSYAFRCPQRGEQLFGFNVEGDAHRADNILQILKFPAADPYQASCSTTEKEVVECLIVTCR